MIRDEAGQGAECPVGVESVTKASKVCGTGLQGSTQIVTSGGHSSERERE